MNRMKIILLALLVLFGTLSLAAAPHFGERPFIDIYRVPDTAIEPGHFRIKLSEEHSKLVQALRFQEGSLASFGIEELDALNQEYGISKITPVFGEPARNLKWGWRHVEWGLHLWFELKYESKTDIRDIIMAYRDMKDNVQWAEPEYKKTMLSVNQDEVNALAETLSRWTPNDPRYGEQWHYHNTGQTGGTVDADIDLPEAWEIEKGHPDVVVAIIDQGVQFNHPDLAANMWINSGEIPGNGIDDDGNGYVDDVYGYNFQGGSGTITPGDHGSHVAGTVAGVNNNGIGISGVAGGSGLGNGVRLMSTQVFGPSTGSGGFEAASIYGADNGAAISQNSWGYTSVGVYDQTMLDAIDYFNVNGGGAVMDGGITIYAAGNDESSGQWYPGCYSGCFAVAATNHKDKISWYSNYDTWVDVSAPGGETDTVTSQGVLSCWSASNYGFYQGTSMACPHTSGVAALVLSYAHRNGRTMSNTELADLIRNTTDDHYAVNPGYIGKLGTGRINAHSALLAADPSLPSCSITAPANGQVFDLGSTINVTATATDTDGYITGVAFYLDGVLKFNDTTAPYSWAWNSTGATGGSHTLKVIASDNSANTVERSVTITLLAPADEGFESGNFGLYPWENSSSIPWTVQTSEVFSGTYAAKSGAISSNGSTTLSLPVVISTAGNISFYYKVSSESNYDWLRFYIDGVQQAQWSGLAGWSAATYPVPSGPHTFSWTYSKDGWVNSGSDCAWLDHIIFPPMGTYYAPPRNLAATSGNGFVNLAWQTPAAGTPSGYKVYRNGSYLASTGGLNYQDTNVINDTNYQYYLTAIYGSNESDPSNTVYATPNMITSVIIGEGTASSGTNAACPINVWYQSLHGQSVYTAAELNAKGVFGPIDISEIGFNVTGLPGRAMPNYIIRMGHSSANNVASWIPSANLSTVWTSTSYQPTQTGWNMLTLSTPFTWNGTDNLLIDTAFSRIGGYNASGTTQYSSVTNGYRFARNDNNDQTNVFTGGETSTYRPNLKLSLLPNAIGPMIVVSPSSLSYGDVAVGTNSTEQFTIQNSGDQTLTGTITTPTGYTVALSTAGSGLQSLFTEKEIRNTLSFSINAGASKTYDLTFAPIAVTAYNGNVEISSNDPENPATNISITGMGQIGWLANPAISILYVDAATDYVKVQWNLIPNASYYQVWASEDPYGTFSFLGETTNAYWHDMDLGHAMRFYKVIAASESYLITK
ncbi:MAG: S8 family serine peptidase [Candidatus Cloacimonetes bacterium]|nr:S8 family serine peptidase [Candidatus Cloacimonadota bacterium]